MLFVKQIFHSFTYSLFHCLGRATQRWDVPTSKYNYKRTGPAKPPLHSNQCINSFDFIQCHLYTLKPPIHFLQFIFFLYEPRCAPEYCGSKQEKNTPYKARVRQEVLLKFGFLSQWRHLWSHCVPASCAGAVFRCSNRKSGDMLMRNQM